MFYPVHIRIQPLTVGDKPLQSLDLEKKRKDKISQKQLVPFVRVVL